MHEDQVIARAARFPRHHSHTVLGVADDAAILQPRPGHALIWAVDTLVEDTHFRRHWPAEDVGWKALAVNLSDLAAMNAHPRAALLSLGLPPELGHDWLTAFFDGLEAACRHFGVDLVGGDTVRQNQGIHVSLSILGDSLRPVQRSGAQAGDLLAVSGCFGGAAAALAQLESGQDQAHIPAAWLRRLWRPEPRLQASQALCEAMPRLALLDTSDGLARSLQLLCEANGLGCDVQGERIPLEADLAEKVGSHQARQWALNGGEDFELLAAIPPACADWLESSPDWQYIGQLTSTPIQQVSYPDGNWQLQAQQWGFQHFSARH
ncbi:MAG: thiamine-phosphate kinase [Candidatus Sericytochromatia bacterium]